MAVVAEKTDLPVRKKPADAGILGLFKTVDHKKIGLLYLFTGILFLVVGGAEALLIRLQLMKPLNNVLNGDLYNQVLTQHGTVMIFFAATPIIWGIINYVMPIIIGARDVAFPRLNMLSYWFTLAGGLVINASWFLGGAAAAGWFTYVPLSSEQFSPGVGMDSYLVGVMLAMVGTLVTTINFTVTILRMRAPGMTLMRMPAFAWFSLMSSLIAIAAGIPFMVSMILLMLDRWFGTAFYAPGGGGDVLLWQHLFWMFGHPEVYILVLPAFGAMSEVLPTFSRKPLFGYRSMVAAISSISVISFLTWVHHMYTAGLGPGVNLAFAITTKAISVPTAMLFFNWISTMWGGKLRFTVPMHYAVAFMFMFIIGGLTGLVNASSSVDRHFQDNMWIVGHFHYVAIGGIVFALLAGLTYWAPKMFGRMLHEGHGRLAFWVTFIGFNLTFMPQMFMGLAGMPRRVYTYLPQQGWDGLNAVSTIGAFVLALGIVGLVLTLVESWIVGPKAGKDCWGDGRTLEWTVPSPVPAYNFARLPVVSGREPLWEAKQSGDGRLQYASEDQDPHRHGNAVHMPNPSWMPAVVGLGSLILGMGGVLRAGNVALAGLVVILLGVLGWALEDYRGYYLEVGEE